jgi:glycine/D-amino acid oxidase-like deaminating enzyme
MRSHDAVVIGAGVIGLSIAYHLSERGFRVAVVDRAAEWVGVRPRAGETRIV